MVPSILYINTYKQVLNILSFPPSPTLLAHQILRNVYPPIDMLLPSKTHCTSVGGATSCSSFFVTFKRLISSLLFFFFFCRSRVTFFASKTIQNFTCRTRKNSNSNKIIVTCESKKKKREKRCRLDFNFITLISVCFGSKKTYAYVIREAPLTLSRKKRNL